MLENYLEKVYSGIVGMNIGIRLSAPLEPDVWLCEEFGVATVISQAIRRDTKILISYGKQERLR